MMLPLRIELAMTFKAVFLNFWPSAQSRHRVQGAKSGGFGLQHTDFARRCQRFAAISGGMPQGRNGPILLDLSAAPDGELDRFGVVVGEIDGNRELPGFGIEDAAPAVDPGQRLVLTL